MAVGSIRGLVLNSLSFDVHGDSKADLPVGKFEKKSLVTSGGVLVQMTFKSREIKGIDVKISSPAEEAALSGLVNTVGEVPLVVMDVNGATWISRGHVAPTSDFNFMDGKASLTLISVTNEWSAVS